MHNQKHIIKYILLLCTVLPVAIFFSSGLSQYATLSFIQQKHAALLAYAIQHHYIVVIGFFMSYILVTAFSLPVATVFTLLAGALFGFPMGLLLVSFASTLGATCAFLIARFIAKSWVEEKCKSVLSRIESDFKKEGAFYLFALRLVPIFPFFFVNIVMSLLPIRVGTFYWVSQCGMLPGTAVYVYAGTQLSQIRQLSDIASPSLLIAFCLLGVFPLLAKKTITWIREGKKGNLP